jgi:hypothetical protein
MKTEIKMKPYVIEIFVFGKWNFFSDHGNQEYALINAKTIHDSRKIRIRVRNRVKDVVLYDSINRKKINKKEVRRTA